MSEKHKIFDTLDAIRGMGALAVVSYHASGLIGPGLIFESADLAVDLFFMLSGLVIALAYEDRLEHGMTVPLFMELRFVRLYPLYLLGLLIGLIAALISLAFGETIWSLSSLGWATLLGLFYIPNPLPPTSVPVFPLNGPAWSLFFEVVINFVYVAFRPWLTNRVMAAMLGVSFLVLAITAVHFKSLNVGADSVTFIGGAARVTFSFFMGVFVFRERAKLIAFLSGITVHATIPLLLTLAILAVRVGYDGPLRIVYDLVAIGLLMPTIVVLGAKSQPNVRWHATFNFLGVTSYAIYCLHSPLIQLYYVFQRRLGVESPQVQPWAGIAILVVVVIVSKFVDDYYDVPVRRWIAEVLHVRAPRIGNRPGAETGLTQPAGKALLDEHVPATPGEGSARA